MTQKNKKFKYLSIHYQEADRWDETPRSDLMINETDDLDEFIKDLHSAESSYNSWQSHVWEDGIKIKDPDTHYKTLLDTYRAELKRIREEHALKIQVEAEIKKRLYARLAEENERKTYLALKEKYGE